MSLTQDLPLPPIESVKVKIAKTKAQTRAFSIQAVLLSAASVSAALHFLLTLRVPVIGDEAYYWLWSKHLALGYHDHPPLIAWLIAASTLVSNSAFWVRFPALLGWMASAAMFWLFASDVLQQKAKTVWAFLFFLSLPILAISFVPVFPDNPLLFGWLVCMWGGYRALRDGRYWTLAGLGLGIAFLSKLIAVFLVLSFAFLFAASPDARKHLKTKDFWKGVAAAILVSLPLWIWNIGHGFENFLFQARNHLGDHGLPPLASFVQYAGVQVLAASPLLFALLALTVVGLTKRSVAGDKTALFLLAFALPIHAVFGLLPFWSTVGFHWAIPGYLALLVGCAYLETGKRFWVGSLCFAAAMTIFFSMILSFPKQVADLVFPLERSHPQWGIARFLEGKGYGEILGYKELAKKADHQYVAMNKTGNPLFLLTDSYTLSSDLAFYTGKTVRTILPNGQGGEYARWNHFEGLTGKNALMISDRPLSQIPEEVKAFNKAFSDIGESEPFSAKDGEVTRTFYSTILYDLQDPNALSALNRKQ